MGQNNVIELNGKQYDAISGALLGESRIKATAASRAHMPHHGRVIDGFIRHNKQTSQAPTVVKPTVVPAKNTTSLAKPQTKKADIQRTAKVLAPHRPERPKTLMRHAVHKPKTQLKPAIKVAGPSEMAARPVSTLAKPLEKKLSVTQVNPIRLARSRHVAKSHHIQRFGRSQAEQPALAAMPVQHRSASRTAYAARPVQQDIARPKVSHSTALEQAAKLQQSAQHTVDVLEAALARAISHEETAPISPKRRRSHRRLIQAVAGLGAFLIIGGFITYLNMPAIELRVASMRAGFHAEMPDYRPTGYALDGGVQSTAGKVSMSFRSGDSSFKVTQETSDWNSATLLDQTTDQHGAPTQTVQSQGRIIYLYDNSPSKATWVNGGVHYEITGNASLDADELVSLATSM